jgi:hypothetical protein
MKNSITKTRRPGAGRTKGSFSFVILTKAELDSKVVDPNQPIKVSRLWAETLGFKVTSASAADLTTQIAGKAPGTGVEVKEVAL